MHCNRCNQKLFLKKSIIRIQPSQQITIQLEIKLASEENLSPASWLIEQMMAETKPKASHPRGAASEPANSATHHLQVRLQLHGDHRPNLVQHLPVALLFGSPRQSSESRLRVAEHCCGIDEACLDQTLQNAIELAMENTIYNTDSTKSTGHMKFIKIRQN